jgi:subtilisin-like proprotein convertase family protein
MKYKNHTARLLNVMCLSILLMLSAVHTSAMELTANKWQLISFPRLPDNATIDSVFGSSVDNLTSVWTFDNNAKEWQSWPAQAGLDSSNLSELTLGQGYWVKTSANITLDLSTATQAVAEMVLYPGWNLIGLSIDQTMGHEQAMAGVPFLELWKYDANNNGFLAVQKSRGSQIILQEGFTDINPGTGLWIYMAEQSNLMPSMGTLLPPDIDVEPLLNLTEYGVETPWSGFQVGADVDWDGDNQYDFPNTQTIIAFGDFLNRQRMSIVNNGNGVLSWQAKISDGADWLKFEVTDENGNSQYLNQISGSASDVNSTLTLFVDRVGKASGRENNAKITITANGEVSEKTISVSMDVADIIGDYEVNIDLQTIDNKFADLHNPKYFLSLARDGDGIKAFLDEERSLLIPTTTYLSGSYAGDPASNFQIIGQITQSANDELNPFGKEIRRQITYVGRRSDGLDGLSPLDLKGEYYENIYGVFDDPIQLRGNFIASRLSPIPVKQDETSNAVRDNIIPANDTLLVDLDIEERLSITQVISKLEIDHPEPTAIHISLISPLSTTLVLHANATKSLKNLSYDDADVSIDGLDLLKGQLSNGTWQLKITNTSTSVGELTNWQLDVSGAKVYQITGNVEPGIRLKISGCGITRTVTSGPDGSFIFDGLIPCDYEISVAQLGYEVTATTVTVLGCETAAQCQQLDNYLVELTPEQLAELSPRFIPSSNSMKVIASPMQATLSKDPAESIILNGLDVTDYTAMTKALQSRHWQLFKKVNTTTAISEDGYLIDVEYPDGKVPYGKNLISYSEDFTQWSPNTKLILNATDVLDPRGGQSAVYAEVIESDYASVFRSNLMGEGTFPVKAGEYVTFSVFLKAGTTSEARFRFASEKGFVADEGINFTTGTHTGGQNHHSKTEALANGWFRTEVTIQVAEDHFNFYVELQTAKNGSASTVPVGTSLYAFGPQVEVISSSASIQYEGVNYVSNPFNPASWNAATDGDADFTIETVENPSGEIFVGQSVINNNSNGVYAPFVSGYEEGSSAGYYYASMVIKVISGENHGLNSRLRNLAGTINEVNVNLTSGISFPVGAAKVTDLENDFKLVEFKHYYDGLSGPVKTEMYYRKFSNDASSKVAIDTGSTFQMQAAYFGKSPIANPHAEYEEFDTTTGWISTDSTFSQRTNTIRTHDVTSSFANLTNNNVDFNGSNFSTVKVRWRRLIGQSSMQFRWYYPSSSAIIAFREDTNGTYASTEIDGDYYLTTINLSSHSEWFSSDITGVRVDVGEVVGDEFEIDFVKVFSPSLLEGFDNYWPATYTPPKALNEVFASAYIPSGPLHTERSIHNQQDVLISEGTTSSQSWAYSLGNQKANAGIYYLKLNSAVKDAADADETLSYTTDDIHISYLDNSVVHLGNFSVNAAAGSTALSTMDSATFDINRPSLVDLDPSKDSTSFTSEINPATETNVLDDEVNDEVIHEPAGNLNNHYRMFISTGQLYHTGSMYGAEQRLDVGIQSQETDK